MSWHCLQEQEVASSEVNCLAGNAWERLKSSVIPEKSFFNDNETEYCHGFPFGMTSKPSPLPTQNAKNTSNGCEQLEISLLFQEDFHAKTSVLEGNVLELMAQEASYGSSNSESSRKSIQAEHLSRTRLHYANLGLMWSCQDLPAWGMMQNGVVSELPTWEGTARGNDSGLLPRPQRVDGKSWYVVSRDSAIKREAHPNRQLMLIHVTGLNAYMHLRKWWANPPYWEAMMEWPIGWTDSTPLAMDKYQSWLQLHGEF